MTPIISGNGGLRPTYRRQHPRGLRIGYARSSVVQLRSRPAPASTPIKERFISIMTMGAGSPTVMYQRASMIFGFGADFGQWRENQCELQLSG